MNVTKNPESETVFSRAYQCETIPPKGIAERIEASSEERAVISSALDLAALDMLSLDFSLKPSGRDRYRLTGKLQARASQTCVVSLEPVPALIDEQIDVEFWPHQDVARLEADSTRDGKTVPLDGPEPIHDGVIDPGQFAYEHLSSSLDPYPRKEGVQFEWGEGTSGGEVERDTPFAELARLKERGNQSR